MMEYVAHPQYEKESKRPGLCAGVSHYPRSDAQGHEFKIHLTDQNLDDRQLLPSQSDPATDRYNTDAKIQEFVNQTYANKIMLWILEYFQLNFTIRTSIHIFIIGWQMLFSEMLLDWQMPQQTIMKVDKAEIDQFDYVVSYLMPIAVTLIQSYSNIIWKFNNKRLCILHNANSQDDYENCYRKINQSKRSHENDGPF